MRRPVPTELLPSLRGRIGTPPDPTKPGRAHWLPGMPSGRFACLYAVRRRLLMGLPLANRETEKCELRWDLLGASCGAWRGRTTSWGSNVNWLPRLDADRLNQLEWGRADQRGGHRLYQLMLAPLERKSLRSDPIPLSSGVCCGKRTGEGRIPTDRDTVGLVQRCKHGEIKH